MDVNKTKNITGFYLRPNFRRLGKKEIIVDLEIDLLENGNVILTEKFDILDKKVLDKIQEQLLEIISINLVNKYIEEVFEITKKTKYICVVNMFKIEITTKNKDGTFDINITFLKNGYFFLESKFRSVTIENLERIRYFLVDNTAYNLTCDTQCRAVDVLDMIAIIKYKLQS